MPDPNSDFTVRKVALPALPMYRDDFDRDPHGEVKKRWVTAANVGQHPDQEFLLILTMEDGESTAVSLRPQDWQEIVDAVDEVCDDTMTKAATGAMR